MKRLLLLFGMVACWVSAYAVNYPISTNYKNHLEDVSLKENPRVLQGFGAATANDAAVLSIDSPMMSCAGTQAVYATIANSGSNQINSVTVNWSIGGVLQTPVSYSSTLDTVGGSGLSNAQVQLGTSNFATNSSTEIKVWTSNPNATADISNANDTAVTTFSPSLSGTLTINDAQATGGTNFASFNDAIAALNASGVCGPVVINVLNGPYSEQVTIGYIQGVSTTNTVTINGNGVLLADSGNVGGNAAALLLDGANHIIVDNLHILKVKNTQAAGVQFMNQADSNIVRNCTIEASLNSTTTSVLAITFSSSTTSPTLMGNSGSYNLIEANTIIGGYYGVRHSGSSSFMLYGNQFVGNTIQDSYMVGVYSTYTTEANIDRNNIHRLNRSAVNGFNGIECRYTYDNVRITNNWIHDVFAQATGATGAFTGISLRDGNNSVGNNSLIANNLIHDNQSVGNHVGIRVFSCDNWEIYHNTIVENDPNGGAIGTVVLIDLEGASSGVSVKNNLLYLDRATSGLKFLIALNSGSNVTVDYNAYYMSPNHAGSQFGMFGQGVTAIDFAAWRALHNGAFDPNGVVGDPYFVDMPNGDFTPKAAYFDNIGEDLTSLVPQDFNAVTRSTTPDPGAIEYTAPQGPDMSVTNIFTQGASCSSPTDIVVEVMNQGTNSVNGYTLSYEINGVAQTPIAVTSTLATADLDSVTITGIPVSGGAITTVKVDISAVSPGADLDASNNVDSIDLRLGLSGSYTIDYAVAGSSTNFVSFTDFANAINEFGVCGAVTVDVMGTNVTYTEQFVLNEILGASATNTITINGNGNTLAYTAISYINKATVTLNGTDWVTIDSLVIKGLGATGQYGFGVVMTNDADHNTISKCEIEVEDEESTADFGGIMLSGSTVSASTDSKCDFITLEGNTIHGGYFGIIVLGSTSDSLEGLVIKNNIVRDFYYYGITGEALQNSEVSGNEIHRLNRTNLGTGYPLRLVYATNINVDGNRIHDLAAQNVTFSNSLYGMYLNNINNSVIANNIVYNLKSDGYVYGIQLGYFNNTYFIHNTLILDDDNYTGGAFSYARGVYMNGGMTGGAVSNNIFYYNQKMGASGKSHMIYASQGVSTMENNLYYFGPNAPTEFGYLGQDISTLVDWQSSTGKDAGSLIADPLFVDMTNNDFTPQSAIVDGMGTDYSAMVSTDVNGAARNLPSDPGAIEFTGVPCTGVSGITDTVTHNSTTVMWNKPAQSLDILWGPVGFMQASITPDTVHIAATDTSGVITGMNSNTCYDYYIELNCTGTIPGTPILMGPYRVCTDCANGAISGTYTVGGAAGPNNFATMDSVIDVLMGCGIQGPVVFNLQGGVHNGFVLGEVAGSSALNTITFNGSANFADTIKAYNAATAAIDIDGASYVNFNDLHISNEAGNYVVWMHKNAHHINIDNCEMYGDPTTTNLRTAVISASGSSTSATTAGNNASHISVTNSTLVGGYHGVSFVGASNSSLSPGIEIVNNTFDQQNVYGIRTYHNDSVLVEDNYISGMRSTSAYGMYLYYSDNMNVLGNNVVSAATALRMHATNMYDQTTTHTTLIANNMFVSTSSYGIFLGSPTRVNVYHNTVTSTGGTTFQLNGSGSSSTDVDVRNNIFTNSSTSSSHEVVTISPASANTFFDYNLYEGANITDNHSSLTAWQAADTAWNKNSITGAPLFVSTTDLHMLGSLGNDAGDNTVGITTDFDGEARPAAGATAVDMGADEYTPVTEDIALVSGAFSKNSLCLSNSDTIVLTIENTLGAAVDFTVNALTAHYEVTGPVNTTGSITVNTGTLAAAATDDILGFPIDLSVPGLYTLNAWLDANPDNQSAQNDTLFNSVTFMVNDTWQVIPDSVVTITNTQDSVAIEAVTPWFKKSAFMTELCMDASVNYGKPAVRPSYLLSDTYIEVTSYPNADLAGITLEIWGASMVSSHTFPSGTVAGPNGTAIIAVADWSSSTPSPSDYYYHADTNYAGTLFTTGLYGFILKDNKGNVIDAVSYGTNYAFPAISGVTTDDWTGSAPGSSSTWGIRLEGADANDPTGWKSSLTSPQDPNTLNTGVTVPVAPSYTGFDWSHNNTVISNLPQTYVGPYTTSGTYHYVATYNGPCGTQTDTVTVVVNLPGSCPTPTNLSGTAPACDSLVVSWNSATDSALVAYVATGGTPGVGTLVLNDSTYAAVGVSPGTDYDFYVANICDGDTGMYAGPYTINSGTAGAPVASINYSVASTGSLTYTFDGLGSTGARSSYSWDFGDGNTGTGTTVNHTYGAGGPYTITLAVSNACGSDTATLSLPNVSVGENPLSASMEVYPNPSKGAVNIRFATTSSTAVIRLTDVAGKEVLRVQADDINGEVSQVIDISKLSKGIYMLEVNDGQIGAVRRLIKE